MKEAEIRPAALFERYLELSRRDIDTFFSDHRSFLHVACPACAADAPKQAFTKVGFDYQLCSACGSLYLSPRPSIEAQNDYARDSEAVRFWATNFYRETAEARREKIFQPRAEMVADLIDRGTMAGRAITDVGAGYGIFLEELKRLGRFDRIVGIEPAEGLAQVCRDKGFSIVQRFVEDIADGEVNADLATAFEVLEHVFDPVGFVRSCARLVRPGGLVLMTTLTITGFDLQVLWDKSNSIYPPHHINLMSVGGLETLVSRSGLDLVEVTTPGRLDVDIVANAVGADRGLQLPRFVRELLAAPAETKADFQAFLQRARLSSHVRVIARRAGS